MKTEDQTPFSYRGPVPSWYKCDGCRKRKKLFRKAAAYSFEGYLLLACRDCYVKQAKQHDPGFVDDGAKGRVGDTVFAIPYEDGRGFWGFTSVPQEGIDWWERLP